LRFALAMAIPLGALASNSACGRGQVQRMGSAPSLQPVLIKVARNYAYEEPDLLADDDYQTLLKLTQTMDNKVIDSHDLVEYYMTQMNWQCAQELVKQKCGILRSAHMKEKATEVEEINTSSSEVNKFITNWKYASGQYTTIEDKRSHEMIGYDVYTHITSPIRRLVDVINMTLLQDKLGLIKYKNGEAIRFCELWSSQMKVDFINTSTKSIKKIQNNCSLLTLYIKNKDNRKRQYVRGYLFDRVDNTSSSVKKQKTKYTYNVYIPDYKMVSTFKTDERVENYSTMMFTLHLFMDEANLKQKIRVQKKE